MNNLPSGTVTFLFTDIEGSTKLAQGHPDKWESLRERHHAILQSAMDAHNGYVFQIIGDAFCAAFHTAGDALRVAVKSQTDLHNENWGNTPIKVRMGINTGTAQVSEDTDHSGGYKGYTSMARVQRLMSAAHGGQTLISLATEELVRDELPENISLQDMGERRLKDLIRSEHIYQLVVPNLPTDFPPIKTLDAYRHNLPIQLTSFIGREKAMKQIAQSLSEHRLVTLTGAGGTGKTRLALQVAADLLDQFSDGVWFVELASVSDPELIPQTILTALGVNEQPGRTILQILIDYFRERNLLLMLDNCEHLIEASAKLADTLLNNSHSLKILGTSREALGVKGEVTWHVASLTTPDVNHLPALEQLTEYEAVQLFVERALLVQPNFTVTNDNAEFVAQICSRLDGIPLAIELAASRIRALSVDQIAKRLDDRFRLLTGGSRTALERHQTLRATIDWSYNLLTEPERALLRNLTVFSGGWTLEAAEAICSQEGSGVDILDLLTQLVDKSLAIAQDSRYHMLETTRQYAREKLFEIGEGETIRNRHRDWFLNLAERAEPHLFGGLTQLDWLHQLEAEHDNFRAALEWCFATHEFEIGTRMAFALTDFWEPRGYLREGRKWLEAGLAQRKFLSKTVLAKTLRIARRFALNLGDYPIAEAYGNESVVLFRELEDKPNLAWALRGLGALYMQGNEKEHGEPLMAEAMALFQEVGDKVGVLELLFDLGNNAIMNDEHERGLTLINEHQTLAHELGDVLSIGFGLMFLGFAELLQGNVDESDKLYREGLALIIPFGYKSGIVYCLDAFAAIADRRRQAVRSARLCGAARQLNEIIGEIPSKNWVRRIQEPTLASIRNQLSEAAFETACAEGRAMTMEQAIELALEITNE